MGLLESPKRPTVEMHRAESIPNQVASRYGELPRIQEATVGVLAGIPHCEQPIEADR